MNIRKPYLWTLIRRREWIGMLDWFGHALHLPKMMKKPICNAWDRYLGLTDDERTTPGSENDDSPLA